MYANTVAMPLVLTMRDAQNNAYTTSCVEWFNASLYSVGYATNTAVPPGIELGVVCDALTGRAGVVVQANEILATRIFWVVVRYDGFAVDFTQTHTVTVEAGLRARKMDLS